MLVKKGSWTLLLETITGQDRDRGSVDGCCISGIRVVDWCAEEAKVAAAWCAERIFHKVKYFTEVAQCVRWEEGLLQNVVVN